jgi:hypothetical protein
VWLGLEYEVHALEIGGDRGAYYPERYRHFASSKLPVATGGIGSMRDNRSRVSADIPFAEV